TLIELLVVMTILIALAGLLVPTFAGMLTRAKVSTCATNLPETEKSVEEYQQLYGRYPSNLDALSDGTNLIDYFAGGLLDPVNGGTATMVGGEITSGTLTAPDVTALANAGITTVQKMFATTAGTAPAGFDPTFNYYLDYANPLAPSLNELPLAATTSVVAQLDGGNAKAAAVLNKLNLPINGKYIVLGIGPRCDMIGKTMATAPVNFGDTVPLNPEYGYERPVCIFKIADPNIPTFTTAVLVAVGALQDTGLATTDDELQSWYELENE
ncbi:MAG: hypothetical protein ABSG53_14805, partial [Thermoguttaceae bacterium]